MARDNSPKVRQRKQLERKRSQRASYDRILIVSEGSKTEPNYFKEIRAKFRLHTANVEVRYSQTGTTPVQVVEYAGDLFEKGDSHKHIQAQAFEKVFAVFDRDDHQSYYDALTLAASLNGKLKNNLKQRIEFCSIVSVPCFELWLLLHFENITDPLHRNEVVRRLKQYIPGYEKGSENIFTSTYPNLQAASQRSKSLAENHTAYSDPMPFTQIDKLVNILVGLASQSQT